MRVLKERREPRGRIGVETDVVYAGWSPVCCHQRERIPMYIGFGTLVVILVVVAIIYFVRRA